MGRILADCCKEWREFSETKVRIRPFLKRNAFDCKPGFGCNKQAEAKGEI